MGLVCTSSSNSYWTDLEQKQNYIYKQKKINKNKTKNKNKRKNKQTKDKRQKKTKQREKKTKTKTKTTKNGRKIIRKKKNPDKQTQLPSNNKTSYFLTTVNLLKNSWTNFIVWRQITFSWMVKNIRCWILFFVVWHWPTKSTNICMSRIIMNVQNTVRSFIMDFPIFTQVYIFT